jgi:hypothetical protein
VTFRGLTGQTFGRLTAVERAENTADGRARWRCRCLCGTVKTVAASELTKGGTRSCGCLGDEQRKRNAQAQCHDLSRLHYPRAYGSWKNMLARCYAPETRGFANYGGRGIGVCARWRDTFSVFVADMGEPESGLTLDRIDTNADYTPDNCQWATRKAQANNRRNNRTLTHDGETSTVAQWSERTGLTYACIHARISAGWSVDRALTHRSLYK